MRFRLPGHIAAMGFAVGIIITAVGFVLALAVHPAHPGAVDVNSVGWILVVVGLIALLADLLLWSSWGPGYMRRTYVERGPGYGPYPPRGAYGYPRRRTIEEEEVGRQGPGY